VIINFGWLPGSFCCLLVGPWAVQQRIVKGGLKTKNSATAPPMNREGLFGRFWFYRDSEQETIGGACVTFFVVAETARD
jgi:hypothetical protein